MSHNASNSQHAGVTTPHHPSSSGTTPSVRPSGRRASRTRPASCRGSHYTDGSGRKFGRVGHSAHLRRICTPCKVRGFDERAALALVGRAGFTGAVVTVMSEELRDKRQGWEPIPALLGVTEAVATLGVTRQRVLQMISSGSLPATRFGNGWAIQAAAVSGKL